MKPQKKSGYQLPSSRSLIQRGLILGGALSGVIASQGAFAHGYVAQPEARGYACKLGLNRDCGAVMWEPQSLEAPKGFPQSGPADGRIASAALSQFSALDAQTATRWNKRTLKSGPNNFTWQFTANHVSASWRYFITRQGWNPNQPLSRSAFELTPFCSSDGGNRQPPMSLTHRCNVPSNRSGYHVILAVWDVGDTSNAFYNVIDVNIDNGGTTQPPQQWTDIGDINPLMTLAVGDVVRARAFDSNGENAALETRITIATTDDARQNYWPRALAQAINQSQTQLRAGIIDMAGNIVPALGRNDVFAMPGSGIQRVEVAIEQAGTTPSTLQVSGVKSRYDILNGQASLDFSVTASGSYVVTAELFDSGNRLVAQKSATVKDTTQAMRVSLASAQVGRYSLVVTGKPSKGQIMQKNYSVTLQDPSTNTGGYDYVYPQGIQSYKAGTKVLGGDGKVYQCKPFPYSGWCTIYAHQYMPGTGSHWQDAWIRVN